MSLRYALVALVLATGCGAPSPEPGSLAATQAITAPAETTRIVAVLPYATWCGSCKMLDPRIRRVRDANAFDTVEFFAIDYTQKDDAAFFADADTLGVGDTFRVLFETKISTGKLYLIDLASGAVVAEITKDMDEATIATKIAAAAANA